MFTVFRRLALMSSLCVLLGNCQGQGRGGTDPRIGLPLIRDVMSKAQVSGSLAYVGRCDFHRWYPDFPKLREGHYAGHPVEAMREMFSDDPEMRVMQGRDGKIRMVETDVPQDLLEVRIHHLSFRAGPISHGPGMALLTILTAPEVTAFSTEHRIAPLDEFASSGVLIPGDAASSKASVTGDLNEVTVADALDYILQTFPGFWLYESCQDPVRGRTVFFNFFENVPLSAYAPRTQK